MSDLPLHASTTARLGKKVIAVFHTASGVFAVQNACPHQGRPLVDGRVEGAELECPDHNWKFSLRTGETPEGPECALLVWDVKVEGGEVYLSRFPRMPGG